MVVYFWMLAHLLIPAIGFYRSKLMIALGFVTLGLSYLFKEYSYDVYFWYLEYFSNPYELEFLFWKVTSLLVDISVEAELILFFWQCSIFIPLYYSSLMLIKMEMKIDFYVVLLTVFLIFSSLFYLLTTQNAVRQGVALSLLSLVFTFYLQRKYLLALFFSVVSVYIHVSSIIFLAVFLSYVLVLSLTINRYWLCLLGIMSGIFVLVGFYYFMPADSVYVLDRDWGGERSSSFVKFSAVSLVFFVSVFFVRYEKYKYCLEWVLNFRFFLYFTLVPLSFSYEFFARYLYFYYMLDVFVCVVGAVLTRSISARFGFLIPLIVAGFAPNAINILNFDGYLYDLYNS